MKAYRIMTPFWARGEGEGYGGGEEKDKDTIKGRGGKGLFLLPSRMYSHTLPTHSRTGDGRESVLAVQPHTQNSCTRGVGRLAFAVQPHTNAAQSRA